MKPFPLVVLMAGVLGVEGQPLSVVSGTTRLGASSGIATVTATNLIDASNVKYWGAVGNGVTDDSVAIQATIDFCGGTNEIIVPEGTYFLNNTLLATNGLFMRGIGRAGLIGSNGNTNLIRLGNTNDLAMNSTVRYHIEGMSFSIVSSNATSIYLLPYINILDVIDCTFMPGAASGNVEIYCTRDDWSVNVTSCRFFLGSGYALFEALTQGNNSQQLRFIDNLVQGSGTLLYLSSACQIIVGNKMEEPLNGIVIDGGSGLMAHSCTISHNVFESAGTNSFTGTIIYKGKVENLKVTDNYANVHGAGGYFIAPFDGGAILTNAVIANNSIANYISFPIYLTNAFNITARDNWASVNGSVTFNPVPLLDGLGVGVFEPSTSVFNNQITIHDESNGGTLFLARDAGELRGIVNFGRYNGGSPQLAAQLNARSDGGGNFNGQLVFLVPRLSDSTLQETMRLVPNANDGSVRVTGDIGASTTIAATNGFVSMKNNKAAPTSITVGASVFNYTNTQAVNIQVFLDANGATTAVTFNGTTIFSSLVAGDHTIIMQPGDRIGVTYSITTPIMNYREF